MPFLALFLLLFQETARTAISTRKVPGSPNRFDKTHKLEHLFLIRSEKGARANASDTLIRALFLILADAWKRIADEHIEDAQATNFGAQKNHAGWLGLDAANDSGVSSQGMSAHGCESLFRDLWRDDGE